MVGFELRRDDRRDPLGAARARFASAARDHLSSSDAELYLDLLRPAVRFEHAIGHVSGSRLGGLPILEGGVGWPAWRSQSLSLLAVVDLADVAGVVTDLQLPPTGFLNFFYEAKEQQVSGLSPDDVGGWRVLYSRAGADTVRATADDAIQFPEVAIRPVQVLTAPGWEEPAVRDIRERNTVGFDRLDDARDDGGRGWPQAPRHQLGGWPILIQAPIWRECQVASQRADRSAPPAEVRPVAQTADEDWALLLQLETDDAPGWMWGDAGTLYFAICRSDLALRRFDRVWLSFHTG